VTLTEFIQQPSEQRRDRPGGVPFPMRDPYSSSRTRGNPDLEWDEMSTSSLGSDGITHLRPFRIGKCSSSPFATRDCGSLMEIITPATASDTFGEAALHHHRPSISGTGVLSSAQEATASDRADRSATAHGKCTCVTIGLPAELTKSTT
jgi:hypothetical protein